MTDKDELLLKQFFEPARLQQLADNGFSERVMQHIPQGEALRLSRLWTTFCIVLAAVLFVVFRGWNPIIAALLELIKHPPSAILLIQLMGCATLGIFAAVGETLRREHLSWR